MDLFDKDLQGLIARGKSQGYLTYDEVNSYLPDEEVNPDKLDNLLIALEEEGIDLVNEPPTPEFYDAFGADGGEEQSAERLSKGEVPCSPVDPPPLPGESDEVQQRPDPHVSEPDGGDSALGAVGRNLAGQEDRSHAEALPPHGHRLRMAMRATIAALAKVHNGALPFDRTIKVSLTERLTKEQIIARMPHNLHTLSHLIEENQKDFNRADEPANAGRRSGWTRGSGSSAAAGRCSRWSRS